MQLVIPEHPARHGTDVAVIAILILSIVLMVLIW
jgi:hypothetical protein